MHVLCASKLPAVNKAITGYALANGVRSPVDGNAATEKAIKYLLANVVG